MRNRIVSTILLLAVLAMSIGSFAKPVPVQASVGSAIAQGGGCVGSGILSGFLSGLINQGLNALKTKIKEIANKYLNDLFSSLVEGFLSASVPTSAKDQSLLGYLQNKDYRDAVIARCLARLALDNLGINISTVIQTRGRDGGPTLVQNWRIFQTNAQYRGENIFRAMLSTANLCPYFANDLKKQFGLKPTDKISLSGANTRTDSLQTFSTQIGCTMPSGFSLQKYQQDFAGNGGWAALVRLSEPQNNPAGAALLAQDEIAKQRALEVSTDVNQVLANKGMTGISGNGKKDSCKITGFGGACLIYKNIKTTGEYLADSAAANIGAQFAWLTTAQGLNSIIEDVTQNMINRLFDQSNNSDYTIATNPTLIIPGVTDPTPNPGPGPGPGPNPGPIYPPDTSQIAAGPGQCSYTLLGMIDNALVALPDAFSPIGIGSWTPNVQLLTQVSDSLTLQPFKTPTQAVLDKYNTAVSGIDATKNLIFNVASGVTLSDINASLASVKNNLKAAYKECINLDWPSPPPPPTGTTPPGPNPGPGPSGSFNLNTATIDNGPSDVSGWSQTANLTGADLMAGKFYFNKRDPNNGGWPWQDFDGNILPDNSGGNGLIYTAWIFIYNNGKWVGSGFGQCYDITPGNPSCLKPDQALSSWGVNSLWYTSSRWPDMFGHVLQSGEQIGIMVTAGNERGGVKTSVKERSNVFMVTLP